MFIWTGAGIQDCVGYRNQVFMAAEHLENNRYTVWAIMKDKTY